LQKLQKSSFSGTLYCINPKATEIRGLPAYPNLSSLPLVPDLAMVCVAAAARTSCSGGMRPDRPTVHSYPDLWVQEIGTEQGRQLEEQIASIAKEKGLLIIGPNCMGPYCPASGLTVWER